MGPPDPLSWRRDSLPWWQSFLPLWQGSLPWRLGPVAHRGLHNRQSGVIENTASAFAAAIAGGYAIETDIQAAAGQEPMVFHDERLERLTHGTGAVAALGPAALQAIAFKETADRILTLAEFLELVAGRVPVFLEIKTSWGGPRALEENIAARLKSYKGPLAVMSFDPGTLSAMRRFAPSLPRGLVSMRFTAADWPGLSAARRFGLTHLLDFPAARPNFLAYHIGDLPRLPVTALRQLGLPVLTWTVRTEEQRRKARVYADAVIFEDFRPEPEPLLTNGDLRKHGS